MTKIIFYFAVFCLLSQAFGNKRFLDSTLYVTKDKLEVTNGVAPIHFKCSSEWAAVFTNNGQTITLNTLTGSWTLKGLSSEVASAAVSEGAPLVSAVAGGLGVEDVEGVTASTLALASKLASAIGSPTFDIALSVAVDKANSILDGEGIHPSDYNKQILDAIPLLGPSGTVIDASDVSVADVHKEATKTIGLVLNSLASAGVINLPQVPDVSSLPVDISTYIPTNAPADIPTYIPTSTPADVPTYAPTPVPIEIPAALPAAIPAGIPSDIYIPKGDIPLSAADAAALAAYTGAGGK